MNKCAEIGAAERFLNAEFWTLSGAFENLLYVENHSRWFVAVCNFPCATRVSGCKCRLTTCGLHRLEIGAVSTEFHSQVLWHHPW